MKLPDSIPPSAEEIELDRRIFMSLFSASFLSRSYSIGNIVISGISKLSQIETHPHKMFEIYDEDGFRNASELEEGIILGQLDSERRIYMQHIEDLLGIDSPYIKNLNIENSMIKPDGIIQEGELLESFPENISLIDLRFDIEEGNNNHILSVCLGNSKGKLISGIRGLSLTINGRLIKIKNLEIDDIGKILRMKPRDLIRVFRDCIPEGYSDEISKKEEKTREQKEIESSQLPVIILQVEKNRELNELLSDTMSGAIKVTNTVRHQVGILMTR